VAGLYILQYGENIQNIKNYYLKCAHKEHIRLRQNKQAWQFQILMKYLDDNDPLHKS